MKKLTKDQLLDLVFNKCAEITRSNSEKVGERMSEIINEAGDDGGKMIVDFVVTYGNEVKSECCQTVAEILYEVLYSEKL